MGADLDDLETVLEQADVLTIHTPLTEETSGLIGEAELAKLDDGVNCARGGIVDEAALAEAVANSPLESAAVDVFAEEPAGPENPLIQTDEIVMTPIRGRRPMPPKRPS